jgi:hypothetical protein
MMMVEKHAFEVRAMQSQLMIIALHCNDAGYNTYVQQYQADLSSAYQQIGRYFARVNGTSGNEERDAYITQLANAQEKVGLRRPDYCVSMHAFAVAALAARSDQEVEDLLIRNGTNVARLQVCADQRGAMFTQPAMSRAAPDVAQRPMYSLDHIESGH